MDIAFLYIAEAYQCYHGAAIALDLARRPGVRVTTYYNDPEAPHHLERIRLAHGAPPMVYRRLGRSWLTRFLQGLRKLGMMKTLVMWDNRAALDRHDAICTVEDSVAAARRLRIRRPRLILAPHGVGDRAVGFAPRIAKFDFVILAGPKLADRMLDAGLAREGDHAVTGYPKLETGEKLRQAEGCLFEDDRPIVLYNAHKAPGLESWSSFIEPMLGQFAASETFNLIVAPHVKLFRRKSRTTRDRWEARGTRTILIDTGSDRSVDMSYTAAADIYVGDVSSQVYEFLARPRPCVFLNPRGIKWRDDPNFLHWHLGDVIETPEELMPALHSARERHALYVEKQEALAAASLGDRSPGAATRAGDAIMGFLAR